MSDDLEKKQAASDEAEDERDEAEDETEDNESEDESEDEESEDESDEESEDEESEDDDDDDDDAAEAHGEDDEEEPPAEEDGARAGLITFWVIGTVIGVVLTVVGVREIYLSWAQEELNEKIFNKPNVELRELRASEQNKLTHYQWVSQKDGVVRIPLDRSIELTLADYRNAKTAQAPEPTKDEPAKDEAAKDEGSKEAKDEGAKDEGSKEIKDAPKDKGAPKEEPKNEGAPTKEEKGTE